MFQLLFSSLTFLCCINVILTDCPVNCGYKDYIVSNKPTSWFDAHILCLQAGMTLATVENREEQHCLEKELDKVPNPRRGSGSGYWISGFRRKTNELVWFTNGRPLVYSKFANGQPDNYGNNEACVEVYIEQPNRVFWNDYTCDGQNGYICQKSGSSGTTTRKVIQCGTVAQLPKPLINNGQETIPGQFPWHVAIYFSSEAEIKYLCGGTLVSEQHVVSAAHCVTKPNTNQVREKDRFLIYLGKYNLIRFGSEVQERLVNSIDVHPDFNPTKLHNDISIIKLKSPVEITNYVRPVCLWLGDSNFNEIVGKQGIMVGWGFTERHQLSQNLVKAEMPIIAKDKCIFSNPEFFSQFLHETSNFCVGFKNGTSACNGDSGGGFVLPRPGTSGDKAIWQLRGVVSSAVATQSATAGTVCNPNQYSIFTDVAVFVPWLKTKMSSSGRA